MEIGERIMAIISAKQLNKNSFSKAISIPPQTLHHIVGGRFTKPGYEILQKILSTFTDISAEWLLTGKGIMFKQTAEKIALVEKNRTRPELQEKIKTYKTQTTHDNISQLRQLLTTDEQLVLLEAIEDEHSYLKDKVIQLFEKLEGLREDIERKTM